jgi:hypothetical protein
LADGICNLNLKEFHSVALHGGNNEILNSTECGKLLVGKRAGEKPVGRPRRRLEDNIKMDLREVGPNLLWGPLSPLFIGYRGLYTSCKAARA